MITPDEVIRRIELYYAGGVLQFDGNGRQNGRTLGDNRPPAKQTRSDIQERSATRPKKTAQSVKKPATAAEVQTARSGHGDTPRRNQPPEKVLLKFRHGLGDAVQLTSVLEHLRHAHPHWQIHVACLTGKHSIFHGLCDGVLLLDRDRPDAADYDRAFDLEWPECAVCYADSPSTKVERSLREVFDLQPRAEFCRYRMLPRQSAFDIARRYLQQVCRASAGVAGRFPVVLIHYQGNTSAANKDPPHAAARRLCDEVIRLGRVPIILDWDRRSPLPDGQTIHNPHCDLEMWGGTGTGDAEVLAALIELSELMIGVDSGPLHVAGAMTTPTLGVWTRHHPLHYFGHADHVTHLVPAAHESLLRGDRSAGGEYFRGHYRYSEYEDLEPALVAAAVERLRADDGGLVFTRNYWIRANNSQQDLVVVKDIAEDDSYCIDDLPMAQPVVVDVGAHIGCFSKRLHGRNPLARIIAVECCPENLPALRKNIGGFATVIPGAMTYENDVALLNAVFPDCVTTGGSRVVTRAELERLGQDSCVGDSKDSAAGKQYWADDRPMLAMTLDQLMRQHRIERIAVLKLDCEGSEFSILEHAACLDRVDRIVGEYHGRERFLRLLARRLADWDLRILKDGELGTFWLTNPAAGHGSQDSQVRPDSLVGHAFSGRGPLHSPWIYLCTPLHTGTHFLRVLLELHPRVSFWKCGRTQVAGKTLGEWHRLHRQGSIRFGELLRLGVRCEPDLPEWTRQEAAKLGLSIPEKHVEFDLIHHHAQHQTPWYPSLPTVVSVRDPLLAVISALRRSGPEGADAIVAGVCFLATKREECFLFCVDQWQAHRQRALDLLSYLDLEPTQEIYDYISKWPSPNAAEAHEHLIRDKSPELAAARRLAVDQRQVHPSVADWARRLRDAGLQEFYESLGYEDLAWFE